jgi:hypothetical protein
MFSPVPFTFEVALDPLSCLLRCCGNVDASFPVAESESLFARHSLSKWTELIELG